LIEKKNYPMAGEIVSNQNIKTFFEKALDLDDRECLSFAKNKSAMREKDRDISFEAFSSDGHFLY
jgi:hypothetical protein